VQRQLQEPCSRSEPQLLLDQPDEALSDLGMTRNGRLAASREIGIDVMTCTMPLQVAAAPDERTYEIAPLHTSTPSSNVCAPTCAGSASVSSIIR